MTRCYDRTCGALDCIDCHPWLRARRTRCVECGEIFEQEKEDDTLCDYCWEDERFEELCDADSSD